MKKIGICGHFGLNQNLKNGQTVKTVNLYNELCKQYGEDNIGILDTYDWKKNPIGFIFKCIKFIRNSKNLLVLTAQNGVKVFIPLFAQLNKIFKINLIYIVVGGWLPEFVADKKLLINNIKKFSGVLVETNKMKEKLENIGLNNVDILFNFKNINIISPNDFNKTQNNPLRVCTFSRVIEEKGIENAINAVKIINDEENKIKYVLDIYGPIADNYKEKFSQILEKADQRYVFYKGEVPSEQSVDIIKNYDLLLFPTYYPGEGLPGTVIDAFSAGVPVAASDWKYNADIVTNGKTGFIFETKNDEALGTILRKIYLKEYDILNIKNNCLMEARKYLPEVAIKGLLKRIV